MVNPVYTFDEKLSRLPFLAGVARFQKLQGRNKAIVLGARGTMGEGIVNATTRADVGTFRQDVDLEALEESRKNITKIQSKAVGVYKLGASTQRHINRSGLVGAPVVFEKREPFAEITKAHQSSRKEAEDFVISFLENAITNPKVRRDYEEANLIIEAGPELLPFKQNIFEFFNLALKSSSILASNTSSLRISEIAERVDHPENVVGLHFFKPADRNPLLEIIATEKTSPEVIETMRILALSMGKQPIICWKDAPGAVANRILVGVINELGKMADEGVYSSDFLDQVFLETFYDKQAHVKDKRAQTQFEEAPRLAFFKDEVSLYKKIKGIDEKIKDASKKGWKGEKELGKLFDEKLALIKAAAGELGQKRIYASIAGNFERIGSFFKASARVKEAEQKAAAQLAKVNEYLARVKANKENLIEPFVIEPYSFQASQYDKTLETEASKESISNRLKAAYMCVAAQIDYENLASVHDIEIACKQGFKWNIGPFELMNQLGIEKAANMMEESLKESYIPDSGIYVPNKEMIDGKLSGVQSFIQNGIGFIELGRLHIQNLQQMQNSLSLEMLVGIQSAMNRLKDRGAKAIVISSQGGGVFSAGADLSYAQSLVKLPEDERNQKLREFLEIGKTTMQFIKDFELPTLALIDGAAVGGGAEMSSACDYRIMVDEESYIAFPEVGLGLIPEWLGVEFFPGIVGKELAKAMICNVRNPLKAPKLTARDAKEVGFAHAVVPRYELYSFLAKVIKGNVTEIDLLKKPSKPQNFDKEDYSYNIRKKFGIEKGFRHRGGSLTKRWAARQAERFIDNSHDPSYSCSHSEFSYQEQLGRSFERINRLQIQPFVQKALSDKWLLPRLNIAWNLIRSIR